MIAVRRLLRRLFRDRARLASRRYLTRNPVAVVPAETLEIRTMASRVAVAPVANLTVPEDSPPKSIPLTVTSTAAASVITWNATAWPAGIVSGLTVRMENSRPTLHFTPLSNANGQVTITLTATLPDLTTKATRRINVSVTPVNDRPTLVLPSAATSPEDAVLPVPFRVGPGGGRDEAGQAVSLSARFDNRTLIRRVTFTGEGASRTAQIDPQPNAHGTATVTVVATDDRGARRTAQINIEIRPVNDPPVLKSQQFVRSTNDDDLRVSPAELLAGATDPEGDPIRVVSVSSTDPLVVSVNTEDDLNRVPPTSHAAKITPQGGLEFRPALGFTGRVKLSIVATDGSLLSEPATITIDVIPSSSNEPDTELVASSMGSPFGHAIALQASQMIRIGGGDSIGRTGRSAFNRGALLLGVGHDGKKLRAAESRWWDVWANPSDWMQVVRAAQSMLDDNLGVVLIGSDDLGLVHWNGGVRSPESQMAADFFGIDLTQIDYRSPLIVERWPSGAARMKLGATETAIRMTIQAPVGEPLLDLAAAREAAAELRNLPSAPQDLAVARVRAELTRQFGGDDNIIYRVADEALQKISWPRLLIDAGRVTGNALTQRLGAAIATSPLASLVSRELIATGQTAEAVASLLGGALLERLASGATSPHRLIPWPQDLLFPPTSQPSMTNPTGSGPALTTPSLVAAALDAGWRSRLLNATSGLEPIAAQIPGLQRVVVEIDAGEPLTDWELVATVLNSTKFLERLHDVATRAGLPQPAGLILNLASGFTNSAVGSFVNQINNQSQQLPYGVRLDIARTLREGVHDYLSGGFLISTADASESSRDVPVAPDRVTDLPEFFNQLGRVIFVPETKPAPSGGENAPGGTTPAPAKDASFATLLMSTASEVIAERAAAAALDAVPDELQPFVSEFITPIISEKVNQFAFQVISSAANGLQLPGLINNAYAALGNFTNGIANISGLSNVPSGVFQAASIIASAAGAPVEVTSGINIVAAISTGNPVVIVASIVQTVVDVNAQRRAIKAANRALDVQYNREIAAAIGTYGLRFLNPGSASTQEFMQAVNLEIAKEDQDQGRLGNELRRTLVQQWKNREVSPPVEIPQPVSGNHLAPDQYAQNIAFAMLAGAVADVLGTTDSPALFHAAFGRLPATPAEHAASVALGTDLVALRQSLPDESSNPDPEDDCDCLLSRDEWYELVQLETGAFLVDRSNLPEAIKGLEQGIYPYYAGIFLKHPELHWAGIAAYVGEQNVNTLHLLERVHSSADLLNAGLNPEPLNNARDILTALFNAGIGPFQTIMVSMGYEIFDDIGWVLGAYSEGGLPELACLVEHGELSPEVYQAFVAFHDGRHAEGSVALAQYEQLTVANPVIRAWRASHPVHSGLLENPVVQVWISTGLVGDLGLGKDVRIPAFHGDFFDTKETTANDRFQFAQEVVSAFSDQLSDSDRRRIVTSLF